MNILFLVDSLHSIAAGSERQIYKLIDGLVAQGHNVSLKLLRHTDFTRQLTDFPCARDSLDIHSISSVNALRTMINLRKQIIQDQVDIIHAYFPDSCILAPLFLKTKKNALFTSRRDMGLIYQGKPAWIYGLLAKRTDAVISNSIAVSDFIAKKENLGAQKTRVIYNGLEEYTTTPENSFNIFTQENSIKLILVANIKPVKRTLDAVIAVTQLIEDGHNIELALVGENQDKDYVASIVDVINKTNSSNRIRLTGSITEPRRLLPQAHIGLLVSESEGLSNTIMEYMHAGLPVIATNVGGNPELVIDKHTGLLIEKGDIQQLKSAILSLAANRELRESLGAAGKSLIQNEFSIVALISKHEAIYTSKSIHTQ